MTYKMLESKINAAADAAFKNFQQALNAPAPAPVTVEELRAFVADVSKAHNDLMKRAYPTSPQVWGVVVLDNVGPRYARLASVSEKWPASSRSAFAFIDMTNGDILKPAGWKTPAKHARGNIRKGDASDRWNFSFTGASSLCVRYLYHEKYKAGNLTSMTKKSLAALANEISKITDREARASATRAVISVAQQFNPRFDAHRFALACNIRGN